MEYKMPVCETRLCTAYVNYLAGSADSDITQEFYYVTKSMQSSKYNLILSAISLVYCKYNLFVTQYCSGFPIRSLIAQIVCWLRDSKVYQTGDVNYGQFMTFLNAVADTHGLLEKLGTVEANYIKNFNTSMKNALGGMCGNLTPPVLSGDGYNISCHSV